METQVSKETLHKSVSEFLDEIRSMKDYDSFRCHEMARLLRTKFNQQGIQAQVRDGSATYSPQVINKLFAPREEDNLPEWIAEKFRINLRKPLCLYHSWCEVENYIVDYLQHLQIDRERSLEELILINEVTSLDSHIKYNPSGSEINLFGAKRIYIPPFCLTSLRI